AAPPTPAPPEEEFPDLDLLPRGPGTGPAPDELPTAPLPRSDGPESSEEEAAAARPGPPQADAVDELLASFEVSGAGTTRAVPRALKGRVGLEPTPAAASAPARDSVYSLLAIADQSIPIANVRRQQPAPTGTLRYPPRNVAAMNDPAPPTPAPALVP